MGITIQEKDKYEINLGPSEVCPGKIMVTIFAADMVSYQKALQAVHNEYRYTDIKPPIASPSRRWCSYGRVWN